MKRTPEIWRSPEAEKLNVEPGNGAVGFDRACVSLSNPPVPGAGAKRPIIALVDWMVNGHHLSYIVHFTEALMACGYDVLVMIPNLLPVKEKLEFAARDNSGRVFYAYPERHPRVFSKIRQQSLRSALRCADIFVKLGRSLRMWESTNGLEIASVFFACIDAREFRFAGKIDWLLGKTWGGLLLHVPSQVESGERAAVQLLPWIRAPRLSWLGILDERKQPACARATTATVIVINEVADPGVPVARSTLAERMVGSAKGRAIVLLIGHLNPYKGLLELILAAELNPDMNVLFAFVGDIPWASYTSDERTRINRFFEEDERCWFHPYRVLSDETYNDVIRCATVVYAAYRGFNHSSNTVLRAAMFLKPIIVSEGGLMAEHVRSHGLGVILDGPDAGSVSNGIRDALTYKVSAESAKQYCEKSSVNELALRLARLSRELHPKLG